MNTSTTGQLEATSVTASDPRPFRESRSILAESIWFGRDGELKWCDITSGLLYSSSLIESTDQVISLEPPIPGFQPARTGGYVVAARDTISLIGADGNDRRELARIPLADTVRFNEVRCDPAGRLLVGSMDVADDSADCSIYSVDERGGVRTVFTGVSVANGFEWSDDGTRFYFADTPKSTLYVADYSAAGDVSNVRPFVTGAGVDGTARDVDGGIWAGINDTAQVIRFDANGSRDLVIDIPAGHVTSVAFGGSDFSTLYVATSRENLTEQELVAHPLSGSVFELQTTTHGYPPRIFGTARLEG